MAKITFGPMVTEIRGKIGGFSIRRTKDGGYILATTPRRINRKPSEAQKAHQQRFKQAVAYAKTVMADPALRARYEEAASTSNKSPFALAVSDYFKDRNVLQKE